MIEHKFSNCAFILYALTFIGPCVGVDLCFGLQIEGCILQVWMGRGSRDVLPPCHYLDARLLSDPSRHAGLGQLSSNYRKRHRCALS